MVAFDPASNKLLGQPITKRGTTLGCLFWIGEWIGFPGAYATSFSAIHQLLDHQIPVAIFDEIGDLHVPPALAGKGKLKIYTIAAQSAGAAVAHFLLKKGHTRVAFISPHYRNAWSVKRHIGITETYAKAGYRDAVVPATLAGYESGWELLFLFAEFDETQFEKIMEPNTPASILKEQVERYSSIRGSLKLPALDPLDADAIRKDLNLLLRLRTFGIDSNLFARIRSAVLDNAHDRTLDGYFYPLFAQVLAHRELTAWIADCDIVALKAIRFLGGRGLKVPQDISVVGFDNLPVASTNHLTTFSFEFPEIGRQMLQYVLKAEPHEYHARVVVEGIVVERESTAQARKLS
jgi:hypothetical protein